MRAITAQDLLEEIKVRLTNLHYKRLERPSLSELDRIKIEENQLHTATHVLNSLTASIRSHRRDTALPIDHTRGRRKLFKKT